MGHAPQQLLGRGGSSQLRWDAEHGARGDPGYLGARRTESETPTVLPYSRTKTKFVSTMLRVAK